MIQPSPRTILFPYTTLFRSRKFVDMAAEVVENLIIVDTVFKFVGIPKNCVGISQRSVGISLELVDNTLKDRKSTRLNSSHVSSSYAVFCLKTKIVAQLDNSI